jgi:hypothetical protein
VESCRGVEVSGVSTRPDRPRKYRNVPTVVDGIRFDSKAEARRYSELRMLEKCGAVRNIIRQPSFTLCADQDPDHAKPIGELGTNIVGIYRGDFQYEMRPGSDRHHGGPNAGWRTVVEDVKGIDTPMSKWKRKHVKAQYGIDVQLVR